MAGNCIISYFFEVIVNLEFFIFLEDIMICQGDMVLFIVFLGEAFVWLGLNLVIDDEQAVFVVFDNFVVYIVSIMDNLGCMGMDFVMVEVFFVLALQGDLV